jgi:hypothetical protein
MTLPVLLGRLRSSAVFAAVVGRGGDNCSTDYDDYSHEHDGGQLSGKSRDDIDDGDVTRLMIRPTTARLTADTSSKTTTH